MDIWLCTYLCLCILVVYVEGCDELFAQWNERQTERGLLVKLCLILLFPHSSSAEQTGSLCLQCSTLLLDRASTTSVQSSPVPLQTAEKPRQGSKAFLMGTLTVDALDRLQCRVLARHFASIPLSCKCIFLFVCFCLRFIKYKQLWPYEAEVCTCQAHAKCCVCYIVPLHWLHSFIHSIQGSCLSEQLPMYQTVAGEEASEVLHPGESVVGMQCEIHLVFENTAVFRSAWLGLLGVDALADLISDGSLLYLLWITIFLKQCIHKNQWSKRLKHWNRIWANWTGLTEQQHKMQHKIAAPVPKCYLAKNKIQP